MNRLLKFRLIAELYDLGVFSGESIVEALHWLILTSLGGLLPLWGGFIILKAFSQSPSIITFAETGEFAVFGAGILSSSIFEVTREMRPNLTSYLRDESKSSVFSSLLKINFPFHRPILISSLVLILVAAIAFSVVTFAALPGLEMPIDRTFLRTLSLGVFIGSLIIGLLVAVFSNARISQIQIKASRKRDVQKLEDDFDAL